ncbi:MAG TPA: hypothetical protein VLE53_14860 [Gemmatimonadaceae bacterium]|nr:hypothetical protein [Gemmatimonadaceae bacterium]
MRTPLSFRIVALVAAGATAGACASGADTAATADSAAAAPAPASAPQAFSLMAADASWQAEITPTNIIFVRFRGTRPDSLFFDYRAPDDTGALQNYEVLRTSPDTTRIAISLARTPCTDQSGNTYTHMAQIWLTGKQQAQGKGCANKK